MRKVSLYHALPASNREDLITQINIELTVPEMIDEPRSRAIYQAQANRLADALLTALPGGTVKALLATPYLIN